jgi:hypothetical protein
MAEMVVELLGDFLVEIRVLEDGLLGDCKIKICTHSSVPFALSFLALILIRPIQHPLPRSMGPFIYQKRCFLKTRALISCDFSATTLMIFSWNSLYMFVRRS